MAKKTQLYRMEAIAGLDLDVKNRMKELRSALLPKEVDYPVKALCERVHERPDWFFAARWSLDCNKPGREQSAGAMSHRHAIVRSGAITAAYRFAYHQNFISRRSHHES